VTSTGPSTPPTGKRSGRNSAPDAEFYRSLAIETGGPVLELGCGTGRVLLPIAREELACTGLDLAPDLLDALRVERPPENLDLVCSSMHDFDLGDRRFRQDDEEIVRYT
jgi:ubiquinone/menaquinone biosynthesis C-methylase UbiE